MIKKLELAPPFLKNFCSASHPYYNSAGRRHLVDTHFDVSRESSKLFEVDLPGLICILAECKDICTLEKVRRETHKEADKELYSFRVEGCKPP